MEKVDAKTVTWTLVAVLLVIGGVYLFGFLSNQPAQLDGFASCLKDKKVEFYGAFWCSHCQNQKALFGRSARLLPYIECSTPNGKGQLPVCNEKEIQTYPTWVFPNNERLTGEISLETLSEKSACPLPTLFKPI